MQFIDLKAQQARIRASLDRRIAAVLDHGQYILGPENQALEEQLAAFVGVPHCLVVSSGTDALLMALMALGIGPGEEIITTGFSFFATAEVIALLGARPIYVDVDPRTYNLDPAGISAAITPRTRAILPVSLYGQCADFAAIQAVADRHGLPVIEDGAQSFGATYHGRRSCGLTRLGCTSFFPSKPLGCYGDGGAIFTTDAGLADNLRSIRNHGQSVRYRHERLGINGRLDTLQAAVLLAKLEIFEEEVERRMALGAAFSERLQGLPVVTPWIAPHQTSVYGQYTLQVDHRESVQTRLSALGIPTAVHYPIPLYRQQALLQPEVSLPVTEDLAKRVLSLPFHPYLTADNLDQLVAGVAEATQTA